MAFKNKSKPSATYTIVGLWIVGMVVTFLLIGANARAILWVFLLGAGMSYYTLRKR